MADITVVVVPPPSITPVVAGAGLQGVPGPVGPAGPSVSISTDPENRLTTGTDSGLFVPELVADPLAYYILAKA